MPQDLQAAHLADLHALAAQLGIERFRLLPREELAAAILERDPDATVPERENGDAPEAEGGERDSAPRSRGPRRRRRDEEDEAAEEEPEQGEPVSGVLDITPRGHGFIRVSGLGSDTEDVYVSPSQIRRCEMQRGDEVTGPARKPRRGERYPALIHVDTINGAEPGVEGKRLSDATPVHPSRRIQLAPAEGADDGEGLLVRAVDLLNPLARGQRVLVTADAGSGRTTLMRALAASLAAVEDLEVLVLLVDERPEDVAGWSERLDEDALAIATSDMRSGEQLRLVELAIGRASRRAEAGADVVLLVDSLSRIAVAADDPDRVKPIFGAGRETEDEGMGSLTVIATTLAADEDEGGVQRALATTESSLIALDRELAAAGVFPALDASASRVAGEEHIRDESELTAARALRAELSGLAPAEAAARLRERIEGSADNAALLDSLG